jgi:hypothetical protein
MLDAHKLISATKRDTSNTPAPNAGNKRQNPEDSALDSAQTLAGDASSKKPKTNNPTKDTQAVNFAKTVHY